MCLLYLPLIKTPGRRQSKTPILLRNVDQKSLGTEFLIAICRNSGDIWQSKTLFLSIFDLCLSIVDSVFNCRLPGVINTCLDFLTIHTCVINSLAVVC